MSPVLELKGVGKCVGKQKVLQGITFSLKPGSIFAVFGPNGAGKTTLFSLIAGLRRYDEGTILFTGKRFRPFSPTPCGIRYLPEAFWFEPQLSGRAHLRLFAHLYNVTALDTVYAMAETLGLTPHLDKCLGKYSLGMQRKLGLLLVLMGTPQLVLLDEPTNGLDLVSMEALYALIQQQARQGVAFIISSHRIAELGMLCSQFAILQHGSIVDTGVREPEDLFTVTINTKQPAVISKILQEHDMATAVQVTPAVNAWDLEKRYRTALSEESS